MAAVRAARHLAICLTKLPLLATLPAVVLGEGLFNTATIPAALLAKAEERAAVTGNNVAATARGEAGKVPSRWVAGCTAAGRAAACLGWLAHGPAPAHSPAPPSSLACLPLHPLPCHHRRHPSQACNKWSRGRAGSTLPPSLLRC